MPRRRSRFVAASLLGLLLLAAAAQTQQPADDLNAAETAARRDGRDRA